MYGVHIGGFAFGALGAYLLRTTGLDNLLIRRSKQKSLGVPTRSSFARTIRSPRTILKVQPLSSGNSFRNSPIRWMAGIFCLRSKAAKKASRGKRKRSPFFAGCVWWVEKWKPQRPTTQCIQELGGDRLPRGVWLEAPPRLRGRERRELAVEEDEKLAQTFPSERAGVTALVSAGQICVANLASPERAEKFFKAVELAPVPHSDLEGACIQEGLEQRASPRSAGPLLTLQPWPREWRLAPATFIAADREALAEHGGIVTRSRLADSCWLLIRRPGGEAPQAGTNAMGRTHALRK